jgi:hypothetical protein
MHINIYEINKKHGSKEFKLGRLHEKHAVATWRLGNHLSSRLIDTIDNAFSLQDLVLQELVIIIIIIVIIIINLQPEDSPTNRAETCRWK